MCYVESLLSSERVIYSMHAGGCGVCIGEALDASRFSTEGKSDDEIKDLIDAKYDRSKVKSPSAR